MGQIHGSGAGNWNNAAVVDTCLGDQQGRLYTNSQIVGSGGYDLGIDKSSKAVSILAYEHHEIHDGNHYNIRNFVSGLGSGVPICYGITTPNGSSWMHLLWDTEGTTQTEVRFWEGATLSGGTTVNSVNNNRNSTKTCGCIWQFNSVVSGAVGVATSGTLLENHSKGWEATTPSKGSLNASITREDEWVLKSGTTYLWVAKSVGANNVVDFSFRYYMHTDREKQF